MALRIEILNSSMKGKWDEFVEGSPQGTIYHKWTWKLVVDCVPYYSQKILGIFKSEQIVGGVVWTEKKNWKFHSAANALATQYLGFLLSPSSSTKLSEIVSDQQEIINEGLNYLEKNYDEINLVLPVDFLEIRPFNQRNYSVIPQMTYYLNFENEGELWDRLDGSLRRQINKADTMGFSFEQNFSSNEFQSILKATFSRKSDQIIIPLEIITGAVEEESLKDNRYLFCAREKPGGKMIAGILILFDSKRCYYSLAGTDSDFLSTGVQPWLIWQTLKYLRSHKITTLDFIGANIPSIARFKEHFNPTPKLYFKVQKFPSKTFYIIKKISKKLAKDI